MPFSRRTRAEHDKPIFGVQKFIAGSVFEQTVVLSWQIWLLAQSPYKLIKLGIFQMSITSSKISFGTQFKAHIGANHAARHLRLKKLGNKQKKEKVVQGALTSTVGTKKRTREILQATCESFCTQLCTHVCTQL